MEANNSTGCSDEFQLPDLSFIDFNKVYTIGVRVDLLRGSYANILQWYCQINGFFPSIKVYEIIGHHEDVYCAIQDRYTIIPENKGIQSEYDFSKKDIIHKCWFYFLRNDLIIGFNIHKDYDDKVLLCYGNEIPVNVIDEINAYFGNLIKKIKQESHERGEINIIRTEEFKLKLEPFEIKKPVLNIEDNYNDDFKPIHEQIVKKLNIKNESGLTLLHGLSGTGKTTYIRYLVTHISKKIVYVPPEIAFNFASVDFLNLMINYPDSVLIIEDAENLIEDNGGTTTFSISSLLNITDGLLSDVLSLQIICTFNTDIRNINKALLRKGRLIALYEFKKLEAIKAKALSKKLGFNSEIKEAMCLTDIYNQDTISYHVDKKLIKGFGA